MSQRIQIVVDESVSGGEIQTLEAFCTDLASFLDEPIGLAQTGAGNLKFIRATLGATRGFRYQAVIKPRPPVSAAPMSAAPFIWKEDGRPDWAAMWTGFCELALYGGPPHRGEESALHAPEEPVEAKSDSESIIEIRRGIYETTGLFAELDEPGWIAVTCQSRKMAAWLCATIVLENVDARFEEERLFLPASPDFELKDQVKSVVTVLAKTNHYWQAHIATQEQAALATG
ncbi:MAG: hypothetical protein ACR2PL_04400 [Dehalococcoidia bacterium]